MTDTVRVPREPTEAMLDAACYHGPDTPAGRFDYSDARTVWSAMLAASPQGEGSSAEAHTPQPDAPGWRDIATAPKDGTEVLLWTGRFARVAAWRSNGWMVVGGQRPYQRAIHYWQPLPAPPSAETKRSEPDALPGGLREKIAAIILRKVLQEDYDDLVEGYLDEILMAADEIILLPAYRAVAETYYKRLSLIQAERGEP